MWGKNPKFQGRSHHWCQICVALSKVLLLVPWFIENLLELCKLYLWNYGITELITILRTTELWNVWNYELVKRKNFGTLWNYVLFWKVKIKLYETIKYCSRVRLVCGFIWVGVLSPGRLGRPLSIHPSTHPQRITFEMLATLSHSSQPKLLDMLVICNRYPPVIKWQWDFAYK